MMFSIVVLAIPAFFAIGIHGTSNWNGPSWCPPRCACDAVELTVSCHSLGLREIPRNLPNFITRLDLTSNGISDIPDFLFDGFVNLTYLTFKHFIPWKKRIQGIGQSYILEPNQKRSPYSSSGGICLWSCAFTTSISEGTICR